MSAAEVGTVRRRIRGGLGSTTATVYAILIVVIIVGAILSATVGSAFFTPGNIESLLTATTVLGFVTIGQTLAILIGSLDLSVPFVISLSSVLGAGVMQGADGNLVAGVVTALLASIAIGLINGILVGVVKINGFIATLGIGLIVSGYLLTNYRGSTGMASPQWQAFGISKIGFLPVSTMVMLVTLIVMVGLLARTRTGMHVYAVGGDALVARMSGVRNEVPVIIAHVFSSLFAGIAGLIIVARLGVGSPDVGSQGGYDLLSIAAVVLGGAVLAGGRGSLWGSFGGILIFATIDSVLGILQVNPYLKDVVRGAIIVIAVAVYAQRSIPKRVARFTGETR